MEAENEVRKIETDLDYKIEYPFDQNIGETSRIWPIPGCKSEESDPKSNQIVVILFGWAGSIDKHLAKYSDIYLQRGCIVIRYIAPPKVLFLQTQKLSSLAGKFVQLLKDLELESHPVFFHVFSNGGGFMLSYVLRELAALQNDLHFDIRGTIFDSAPCPRTLSNCFKAVSNIAQDLSLLRYVVGSVVVLGVISLTFVSLVKNVFMQFIYGEPLPCRMLHSKNIRQCKDDVPLKNWLGRICKIRNHNFIFLYSDNDELFPMENVEELAEITESYGNNVEMKKFIGSGHVQHFRMYPQEYAKTVTDFIRRVMTSKKTPVVYWQDY